MALLVALRLALGCHFLYEGVWKIVHPVQFAAEAEGFLTGARGPLAGMFYAMVPDIDGRERLSGKSETIEIAVDDGHGKKKKAKVEAVKNEERARRWAALRDRFIAVHGDLQDSAERVYQDQLTAAEVYLGENWKDIQAHFGALDRFEASRKAGPNTAFQKKRNWDEMRKLRGEAKAWLSELDAREEAFKTALGELALEKDVSAANPLATCWNPFRWKRIEQIQFAITWGVTAIGFCLLVGLFTRPAALGGGVFMVFVVMSQPSWPGMIPADPPQLGHALLVNKDFVEMVALFLIATTAAGRWGGLDYFVYHFIVNPLLSKTICRTEKEG